jgi:ArsR family transcriptional regulator, lead/cadmium/zinc/bismuth-responsive transcriptional repressor
MTDPTTANPDLCEVVHADPARVAVLRAGLPTGATLEALAETFKALGDPTRLRMLTALSGAELCVCDLASLVGISESAASHQLRLLRTLRLVRSRRDGRMVHYRLDDDHIVGLLAQGLDHVSEAGARRDR